MAVHALTSLLAAAVLGGALLAFGYLALRNSTVTLALLLVVWIATSALRDAVDLSVTMSSVHLSALDILSVILATVGVARILADGLGNAARALALVLLLSLAFHIVRGISEFGVQAAINDARGWCYFTAALVYAATVPGGWGRPAWEILTASGVLLAAIAVPYFLIEGLGSASAQVFRDGEWVTQRPIVAAGALVILQAAILAPAIRWPSRQAAAWMVLGTGAVVLLLEHRTVWVAALIVGILGFIWWSARRVSEAESAVFAATGVVILILPFAVLGFARTGPLVDSVKSATSSNSTLTWRTTGWSELLSSHDSASDLAVGQPAGGSFKRLIDGQVVDVSPHDGFVDAYIRFGLPGLLCLLWLGLLLWFRRFDIAAATQITPQAIGLLILTQLVFSIAYQLDTIQGLIAGILVSGLVVAPARAPVALRSPEPSHEHAIV
jgi:hypothetical protein